MIGYFFGFMLSRSEKNYTKICKNCTYTSYLNFKYKICINDIKVHKKDSLCGWNYVVKSFLSSLYSMILDPLLNTDILILLIKCMFTNISSQKASLNLFFIFSMKGLNHSNLIRYTGND